MEKNTKQLVERFYAIVNGAEGDFSEIFHEDFIMSIMKGFPYGGDHIGLIATKKFFEDFGSHFEFWAVDTDKFIEIDSNNIIVTGKYRSKSLASNKNFEMETVHFWTSKNNMLRSYKHYCDTAIVAEANAFTVCKNTGGVNCLFGFSACNGSGIPSNNSLSFYALPSGSSQSGLPYEEGLGAAWQTEDPK